MSRLTYDLTAKDKQDTVFAAMKEVNDIEAECGVNTGFSHMWIVNALGYNYAGEWSAFEPRPEYYWIPKDNGTNIRTSRKPQTPSW